MIEWWYWLALGLTLLAADLLLISTFYLMWLGLGAAAVGIWLYIAPDTPVILQAIIWGGTSLLFTVLWITLRKKLTTPQRPTEIIGVGGVIMEWHNGQGRIRFQRPYGESDVWNAHSETKFNIGDQAKVTGVDIDQQTVTLSKGTN